MLVYLSKEKNEAIMKSVARAVALKNAKEAREKARKEAAVLREEKAKERARERAEKLEAERQKKEEKEKAKAEKLKERQQRKEEKEKVRADKLKERQKKDVKARAKVEKTATIVRKRNITDVSEKVRSLTKSGSLCHAIPQKILNLTGWKRYTRFACVEDPENHQLILEESGEPTLHQITLCCSGCITVNRNMCHAVRWNAGDSISVKHEGKKIIMRRVA